MHNTPPVESVTIYTVNRIQKLQITVRDSDQPAVPEAQELLQEQAEPAVPEPLESAVPAEQELPEPAVRVPEREPAELPEEPVPVRVQVQLIHHRI